MTPEKQVNGELFNTVTHILGELQQRGHSVFFSDRLVCTERVREFIATWYEQWRAGETIHYDELLEEGEPR